MVSQSSLYRTERALAGRPIVDNRHRPGRKRDRKGDKHRKRSSPPISKWERRRIIAWDGEGVTKEDGTHIFNLFANSTGDYIHSETGLTTAAIFKFIFKHHDPKAINVIYGGSYDVNMMLRSLPKPKIAELWQNKTTKWSGYTITYSHRKLLTISREGEKNAFSLWDVLGFFQTTFVNACRQWLGDNELFNEVEAMKMRRSSFSEQDIEDVIAYNKTECDLLVALVLSLFSALDEAGIRLTRYDGAGAIASYLLTHNGVREHAGPVGRHRIVSDPLHYEPNEETVYDGVNEASLLAYAGGRIEAVRIGNGEDTPIWRYDINSAYPYAATHLPSFAEGEWTFDRHWNGNPNSIVGIMWSFGSEAPFYPLWYRTHNGSIIYPRQGVGGYYGYEAEAAIHYSPNSIDILWAYNYWPTSDTRPFSFLNDVYAKRKEYKAHGSMADVVLKLGMNSVYGKLAQQAGYRDGRIPSHHNLVWAGIITSHIRAKLYSAAMQSPEATVAFATDAIFSLEPLDLPVSSAMGEWTLDIFDGITLAQAGVYWLRKGDIWTDKYRGFDKGALQREGIVTAWKRGDNYEATLTRFFGMGSALARTDFAHFRNRWVTEKRSLDIHPTGKRTAGSDEGYHTHLCLTQPAPNPNPLTHRSEQHRLAWVHGERPQGPLINGVPLRVIQDELLDGIA